MLEERKGVSGCRRCGPGAGGEAAASQGLIRQYGDHLEASSKLVESAIQSMEEPQMALYLQVGPGEGAGSGRPPSGWSGGLCTGKCRFKSYLWFYVALCSGGKSPSLSIFFLTTGYA